jgi:N utilization substance protein B
VSSRRKGRTLAFQALYAWEGLGRPLLSAELLGFEWLSDAEKAKLKEDTAAFARLLLTGTIENIASIDALIKKHLSNWTLSRLNRVDLAILRMSVYTLLYQSDIAPSIVIDEAIGISKDYGADDSFKFINGVLDAVSRSLRSSTCEGPSDG